MKANPKNVQGKTCAITLETDSRRRPNPRSRRSTTTMVPARRMMPTQCTASRIGKTQIDSRMETLMGVCWSHWQMLSMQSLLEQERADQCQAHVHRDQETCAAEPAMDGVAEEGCE